ncbi:MAG TPA: response regulator [Cyanobacteria bacterium UBA11049]|nr:response regulator [Cyanobacteria bacterium UBA11049]
MKKILVIEDEALVRANILDLLESEDFDTISADNGFIGALWAQEHLPDLIICDVMMPEVNGYEVINALRQETITARIPFIFLTAMADKSDIRQGMELGADDYLTKPFTRAELLGAIATRFAKQEAVMQQYQAEQERVESLQQKVKELQQFADTKDNLLQQIQQKLQTTVSKLNIAIHLLNNIEQGTQQENCLAILQTVCAEEITLLNQRPDLQKLLAPDNIKLLHKFNLVGSKT